MRLNLKKNNNNVKISKVNSGDENWILLLYNYYLRKNLYLSKTIVSRENHKIWFLKKRKQFFIKISKNKTNFGYMRIEKSNVIKNAFIISIALKKNYTSQGYGKYLLNTGIKKFKKIRKSFKNTHILAIVKKKNTMSKKFFINNNFEKIKISKFIKQNYYDALVLKYKNNEKY